MSEIGELLFKVKADLADIDKSIQEIQKKFDSKPIKLKLALDDANIRDIQNKLTAALGSKVGGAAIGMSTGSASTSISPLSGILAGGIAGSMSQKGIQQLSATIGAYTTQGMSCPQCGNVVPPNAMNCPRCGNVLKTAAGNFARAGGRAIAQTAKGMSAVGQEIIGVGQAAIGVGWGAAKLGARAVGAVGHALFSEQKVSLDDINDSLGSINSSISNMSYGGPSADDIANAVGGRRKRRRPKGGGGGGSFGIGKLPSSSMAIESSITSGAYDSGQLFPTISDILTQKGRPASAYTAEDFTTPINRSDSGVLGRGVSGSGPEELADPVRRASRKFANRGGRSGSINIGAISDGVGSLASNIGRDLSRTASNIGAGISAIGGGIVGGSKWLGKGLWASRATMGGMGMTAVAAYGYSEFHEQFGNLNENLHPDLLRSVQGSESAQARQIGMGAAQKAYESSNYIPYVSAGVTNLRQWQSSLGEWANGRNGRSSFNPEATYKTYLDTDQQEKNGAAALSRGNTNRQTMIGAASTYRSDPRDRGILALGASEESRRNALQESVRSFSQNAGPNSTAMANSMMKKGTIANNALSRAEQYNLARQDAGRRQDNSAYASHIDSSTAAMGLSNKGRYFASQVESAGGDTEANLRSVRFNDNLGIEEKTKLLKSYAANGNAQLETVRRGIERSRHGGVAADLGNFINYAQDSARDRLPQEDLNKTVKDLDARKASINNLGSSEDDKTYGDRKHEVDFHAGNESTKILQDMASTLNAIANSITKVITAQ